MKNNGKIKMILLFLLVSIVLTWFISSGGIGSDGLYVSTEIKRAGIGNIFTIMYDSFSTVLPEILFILAIGGCYGILSKTNFYDGLVKKTTKFIEGKEIPVLLLITLIMGLLVAISIDLLYLLVFVPFIITIFLKDGMGRLTAIAVSFGGMFIGTIGSFYGSFKGLTMSQMFNIPYNDVIGFKITLFVAAYVIFNFFAIAYINRHKKIDETKYDLFDQKVKEYNKGIKARKVISFVFLVITIIIALLALVNWNAMGVKTFTKFVEKMNEFKISGVPVLADIIGNLKPFGEWDYITYVSMFVFVSVIIGFINKLSVDEIINSFAKGASKMVKVAFIVGLVTTILVVSFDYRWPVTLTVHLMGTEFNLFVVIFAILFISIFAVDGSFIVQVMGTHMKVAMASSLVTCNLIFSSIFGIVQVIAPTSMLLMIALTYLDVPYKNWLSYIWKFTLTLFIVVCLIFSVRVFM